MDAVRFPRTEQRKVAWSNDTWSMRQHGCATKESSFGINLAHLNPRAPTPSLWFHGMPVEGWLGKGRGGRGEGKGILQLTSMQKLGHIGGGKAAKNLELFEIADVHFVVLAERDRV